MTAADDDRAHMRAALALARRGLGQTWPNPSVGCVLVSPEGHVLARAVTAPGGRPHAETRALGHAGPRAAGATAYVTLEPCSHQGVTPPCADALIDARVARVHAALFDPDPRVSGRGIARLRAAGVDTHTGLLAAEAEQVTAPFLSRMTRGRPRITLKLATTLDGRIALASGESRWITGPAARRHAHRLRATHDAILVGIGTALADDPDLTCRLPGARSRPLVRIVLDRRARLPPTSRLASTARDTPVWLLHDTGAPGAEALAALGVQTTAIPPGSNTQAALESLAAAGLTSILVEGGATLAAALIREDLVDELVLLTAPSLIGADGIPALAPLGLDHLSDAPRFRPLQSGAVGPDMLATFLRG